MQKFSLTCMLWSGRSTPQGWGQERLATKGSLFLSDGTWQLLSRRRARGSSRARQQSPIPSASSSSGTWASSSRVQEQGICTPQKSLRASRCSTCLVNRKALAAASHDKSIHHHMFIRYFDINSNMLYATSSLFGLLCTRQPSQREAHMFKPAAGRVLAVMTQWLSCLTFRAAGLWEKGKGQSPNVKKAAKA